MRSALAVLAVLPIFLLFACKPSGEPAPAESADPGEVVPDMEDLDRNVSKSERVLTANFRENEVVVLILVTDFEGQAVATVTEKRDEATEEWTRELPMPVFEKIFEALETNPALRATRVAEGTAPADSRTHLILTTLNRKAESGALYAVPLASPIPAMTAWLEELRHLTRKESATP